METQWPLVIFTLFVCLTCGTLGGMSILALKGQGRNLQMTALITSAVSLVVGGIGAFLHLEHWERIFNGFGHITSGITQELIGCVALAIVIVAWFVVLRGGKPVPKALAWATLAVAVLMMVATAHSYLMPARPAWGLALVAFYLGNACLLGAAAVWLISILKKDEAVEATGIQLTFIAALVQIVSDVVFVIACAMAKIAQFGYYADPTSMTTAPTHVDSLMTVMVSGAVSSRRFSRIMPHLSLRCFHSYYIRMKTPCQEAEEDLLWSFLNACGRSVRRAVKSSGKLRNF